jgi:hypothetical protein
MAIAGRFKKHVVIAARDAAPQAQEDGTWVITRP